MLERLTSSSGAVVDVSLTAVMTNSTLVIVIQNYTTDQVWVTLDIVNKGFFLDSGLEPGKGVVVLRKWKRDEHSVMVSITANNEECRYILSDLPNA